MSSRMFTPGPWTAEKATQDEVACVSTTHAPYLWVCIIDSNLPVTQQNANAQLIAAAPALLEALENAIGWIESGKPVDAVYIDHMRLAVCKAREGGGR